jgi:amino acid transporter
MAEEQARQGTLSLFGITMNAMALIAPGAFLWITFQLQVQTGYQDMWFGILFAVIVAFSTAFPYAELARKYPDAGCGGAYNFAKAAFEGHPYQRKCKLLVGWSSHLFYWVYPGVMVGFMATLLDYLFSCDGESCAGGAVPKAVLAVLSLILAALVGSIAFKGAEGSTSVSIVINVVQLSVLIFFSILCFAYRGQGGVSDVPLSGGDNAIGNLEQLLGQKCPADSVHYGNKSSPLGFPLFDGAESNWAGTYPQLYGESKDIKGVWAFENVGDVLAPSSFEKMLLQASVAILILVGFDSATSMGAEAKNPGRDIPKGVILSIAIQGCGAYFLEYFAANAAVDNIAYNYKCDDTCTFTDGTKNKILYGMDAAAESSAPIGDLAIVVGNEMLGGGGFGLMMVMAVSTLLACVGSTLAAMNTAVRFSQAMADDNELPGLFAEEHATFRTPYKGVACQVLWSFFIGSISACIDGGALAVTLASNIGTFALYLMVCICCYKSFQNDPNRSFVKHVLIPIVGGLLNLLMLLTIFVVGLIDDASRESVIIALCLAAVWAAVTLIYWNRGKGSSVAPVQVKTNLALES